jgi:hypothetical protein
MTDTPDAPEPKRRRGRPLGGGKTRLQKTLAAERQKIAPAIPQMQKTEYPAATGRLIPENARREMYAKWRTYTDEVMQFLVGVMRDEKKDTGHRIQAGKEILSRGWGQVPNVEIIEATLRVSHEVDTSALKQMSQAELDAVSLALAKMIRVPGDDARVIDHEP